MVCPHGVMRIKVYESEHLANAHASFKAQTSGTVEQMQFKLTVPVVRRAVNRL